MADLQELADDLAAEIGRPISVEDRRFRLLAHSAHTGATDRVRTETILTRHAPPDVQAWLEGLGLLAAVGRLDVPANDEVGMTPRSVFPVRHDDVLLGFVWVVSDDHALSADDLARLAVAVAAVRDELWERRTHAESRGQLLRQLLREPGAAVAAEVEALLRPARGTALVVGIADGGEELGEAVRRRWPGGVLWAARGAQVLLLAGGDAAALARALGSAGAGRATTGDPVAGAAAARVSLRQAELAWRVLAAAPRLGPTATWAALGGWATVADLWDRAGRPPAPPAVQALREHPHADELVEAVEAVVEAAGDVSAAAEGLHVHRATLYRRLQRARDVSGLDVHVGDERLQLQLGLRIARLNAT